jgi:hypothetical protein
MTRSSITGDNIVPPHIQSAIDTSTKITWPDHYAICSIANFMLIKTTIADFKVFN